MVYYFDSMDAKLKKKAEIFFSQFSKLRLEKGELILEPERKLEEAFYLKGGAEEII